MHSVTLSQNIARVISQVARAIVSLFFSCTHAIGKRNVSDSEVWEAANVNSGIVDSAEPTKVSGVWGFVRDHVRFLVSLIAIVAHFI